MKLKFTLAAAVLALSPTLTFAMGCNGDHAVEQAMTCAEGLVWDGDKGTCVEQVTS